VKAVTAGIACSPVQDVEQQWADPHFHSRAVRHETTHPITGPELLYHAPWVMERNPPQIATSAPLLGQDNERVFCGLLGLSPSRLGELKAQGVVA
jgi:crotonobetainyl-CoA:carnitine CoA-transferase CaiB-like acyl-CoA transferase